MGQVPCPFCGARVTVASDGSVEPTCPRCGAWAVAGPGRAPAGVRAQADDLGPLGTTLALESRSAPGPVGPIAFVRAPYTGDGPPELGG